MPSRNLGLKKPVSTNHLYSYLWSRITFLVVVTGWCKVLCIEDNKTYLCPVVKLESDDGLGLSSSDIVTGTMVIWKHRGTPYEAEILSVYGKIALNLSKSSYIIVFSLIISNFY